MPYTMDRTTPPSTRSAAPLVAEARTLQTYTTIAATSSGVANRFNNEEGRTDRKNSLEFVISASVCAVAVAYSGILSILLMRYRPFAALHQ